MDYLKKAAGKLGQKDDSNAETPPPQPSDLLNSAKSYISGATTGGRKPSSTNAATEDGGEMMLAPKKRSSGDDAEAPVATGGYDQSSEYGSSRPVKSSSGGATDQSTDYDYEKPKKTTGSTLDQDSQGTGYGGYSEKAVKSSGYDQDSSFAQDSEDSQLQPRATPGYGQGLTTSGKGEDSEQKTFGSSGDTDSTYQPTKTSTKPSYGSESYDDSSSYDQKPTPVKSSGYGGQSEDSGYDEKPVSKNRPYDDQEGGDTYEKTSKRSDDSASYGEPAVKSSNSGYGAESGYGKPSKTSNYDQGDDSASYDKSTVKSSNSGYAAESGYGKPSKTSNYDQGSTGDY